MKNLSFIFMLAILLLASKDMAGQQQNLPTPAHVCGAGFWQINGTNYFPGAIVEVCPGATNYVIPVCVVDFTCTSLGTNSAGGSVNLSNPGVAVPFSFLYAGDYRLYAYYESNMLHTDPPNTSPHRRIGERWITIRVKNVDSWPVTSASLFNLNVSNNCSSPLTSVTVNRTYPNNQLWSYEVKLFEVNGTTLTQRWTTGYQNNGANFSSMQIGSAQYNGFTAGKTYQVEVFAKPVNYPGCGIDGSYYRQNFTIAPAVAPKFAFSNTLGSGRNPYTLPLCDPPKDVITVLNQSTAPSCAPILGVDFQMSSESDCTTTSFPQSSPEYLPAASYDLKTIFPQMQGGGYYKVSMRVRTALGWSAPTPMQCIRVIPSTAGLTNFVFSGSPTADAFSPTVPNCGTTLTDEPIGTGATICTDADGWLSNGGTLANPTWVGANYTQLDRINYAPGSGGMVSWSMKIFDQANAYLMGEATGGSSYPAQLNLNTAIFCSKTGAQPRIDNFFITTKINDPTYFTNKVFRVELAAKDICAKEYKKIGYFRIIPTCTFCRGSDNGATVEFLNNIDISNTLKLYPNPANNELNIEFLADESNAALLNIISIDGKTITQTVQTVAGENLLKIPVNDLPTGIYTIQLQQQTRVDTQKFIKIE